MTSVKKYTRDVGVTFPTPSPSEARLEEDSDVTSWSEEKAKEKKFLANYLRDKNLRKNKPNSCEGWFVSFQGQFLTPGGRASHKGVSKSLQH